MITKLGEKWWDREAGRKQEKGTVSRQVPCDCLHIVFSGDGARCARDMLARNGGNPALSTRNCEVRANYGSVR